MAEAIMDEPDYSNLSKWKVSELKRELGNLGLSTKGRKEELVARLEKQLNDQEALDKAAEDVDINLDDPIVEEAGGQLAEEGDVVADDDSVADAPVEMEESCAENGSQASVEQVVSVASGSEAEVTVVKVSRPAPPRTQAASTTSKTAAMTDAELKLERVQRFGIKSDDTRKLERAKRFNLPPSDDDRKARRAARFGVSSITSTSTASGRIRASASTSSSDLEKLKQRAERFGGVVSSPALQKTVTAETLKRRRERFGPNSSEEAKRLKRAERFGMK